MSYSAAADTDFWAIVGDADGNETDYATVLQRTNALAAVPVVYVLGPDTAATDGFVAAPTMGSRATSLVLAFADGTVVGNPFSNQANSTSSTNQRGWYIAGLTESLKLWGMISASASNNISDINVWSGSNGPSGTGYDATGAIDIMSSAGTPVVTGMGFSASVTLAKATIYRIVLTYSANATVPVRHQIGTGADATLKAAMLGGGGIYWAEANGTTNWTNDNTGENPAAWLLIDDQVAVTGGGLMVNPGLSGGLR